MPPLTFLLPTAAANCHCFMRPSRPMIPFTNNPLDRVAERRNDAAWLRARLEDSSTIVMAMRDGKPLVRDGVLARLSVDDLRNNAAPHPTLSPEGRGDSTVFLGVRGDVAMFAIEIDGEVDGTFEDFRSVALTLPEEEAAIAAAARSLF